MANAKRIMPFSSWWVQNRRRQVDYAVTPPPSLHAVPNASRCRDVKA